MMLMAAGMLPVRGAYTPQFFSADEHRALDRLTEMILPTTDHSPGASAARVADFIDLVVANSGADVKARWKAGLAAFAGTDLAALLDRAASEEKSPVSAAGRFFVELKRLTIRAYYTSEIGLQNELGYTGPEAMHSFPGCKG
jgi:hypothetical protein